MHFSIVVCMLPKYLPKVGTSPSIDLDSSYWRILGFIFGAEQKWATVLRIRYESPQAPEQHKAFYAILPHHPGERARVSAG